MPYSKSKLPDNLPNDFTDKQIDTFISTANSALASGEEEGAAIAIGISAAKKVQKTERKETPPLFDASEEDEIDGELTIKSNSAVTSMLKQILHTLTTYVNPVEDKDNKNDLSVVVKSSNDNKDLEESKELNTSVVKFNEEEMIAIEPLYAMPMSSDMHGEGMTEIEIQKMVDSINSNINRIKGNIGHIMNTDGFYFIKAWVNPCDCKIGDEFVPEGQPIIKVQFTDKKLWQMRKEGKLMGLSVGAIGKRKDNPDYSEED